MLPARPCQILIKFSQNVHQCVRTCCAKFCGNILSTILFWRKFKDVRGDTRFFVSCKSRLNLLPYSASRNSTIIADKLMKFAGHLVMVVLIKGCWKNLISEQ